MSKYVTNFTGLVALNEGLSEKCKEIYTDLVDPSCGYELNDRGVFKILEDGKVTVDKLLDICDVELDWYIPSDFAIEFILFIRLNSIIFWRLKHFINSFRS